MSLIPPTTSTPSAEQLAQLARAVQGGSLDAVLPLAWRIYGRMLMQRFFSRGFSQTEAEELLQRVFSRLVEQWGQLSTQNLGGWLSTVAHYEMLSMRKNTSRQKKRKAIAARIQRSSTYQQQDPVELEETIHAALTAFSKMDPSRQQIFLLSVTEGLTPAEIALRIQQRPELVRSRLHEIRCLVRKTLKERSNA